MSPPSSKPVFLLVFVAAAMALLVGMVGSARRAFTPRRALAPPESRSDGRSAQTVLTAPRPVVQDDPAPPTAPQAEPSPARSTQAPRAVLTGLVLRPDGELAAGARVKLGGQQTRSSAEGRFELDLSAADGSADLIAHLPGYEPAVLLRFVASAGLQREVHLTLGPQALALSGTVIDPSGQPLKGWTVELDGPDPLRDHGLREPARTDLEGRFVLNDVPAGIHVVRAWKAQGDVATFSRPIAAGEPGLTIVAPSGE